jgi:nicotinate-nucleotide adenylyltransferase
MREVLAPVGIFGGTFDPIHNAHLRLIEAAHRALGLDHVVLVPAGNPPHRAQPTVSAERRLAMVRLAVAGQSWMQVDDAEVRSASPSYTVTTLERLRLAYGAARPLVLLLGSDALQGLATWHRWQSLFGLAHIAVATRPGHVLSADTLTPLLRDEYQQRLQSDPACLATAAAGWLLPFIMPPMDLSATTIRAAFDRHETPADMLPASVLEYIVRNQLYPSAL